MPDKNLLTPLLIIAVAFTMALCSCSRTDSTELEQLDRQANLSMSSYAKKDLDSIATILLQKARENGNRKYEGKAHFYLSSFHLMLPDSIVQSKLHHLETAKEIAEKIDNDALLCVIYTTRWEYGGRDGTVQQSVNGPILVQPLDREGAGSRQKGLYNPCGNEHVGGMQDTR